MRILVVLLAVCFPLSMHAEEDGKPAAVIESFKGHVYLRAKSGDPETLLTKKDVAKKLLTGARLRCAADGSVTMWLITMGPSGGEKTLGPSEHMTLTWVPTAGQSQTMAKVQDALDRYGRPGVSTRGGEEHMVLSPPADSAVNPEQFTIRFRPVGGAVGFRIRAGERPIWHGTVADGMVGILDSPEARAALEKYRASRGNDQLTLSVSGAGGEDEVPFSLLTAEQKAALETELREWDGEKSLFLRSIGRAATFSRMQMPELAAAEYEKALADSQDSADLTAATLQAEQRAGNLARVKELKAKMDASSR